MQTNLYQYNLLIVESPNKAKTISKYLKEDADEWIVKYTEGHIVNLPTNRLGLKYEEDSVSGEWVYISKKKKELVDGLKQLAKSANHTFIATDDDREGERIASDLVKALDLKDNNYSRVIFREITKKAVIDELYGSVRDLSKTITNAAIANRLIDREIGYPVSNIMSSWFKQYEPHVETKGVGRVITPALGILCEKEKLIDSFESQPYSQIYVDYSYGGLKFTAYNHIKFFNTDILEKDKCLNIINTSKHTVENFEAKLRDKSPYKPFNTPTLQYSGWYVLKLMPNVVMEIAQKLFEIGLITYHRTDSFRISKDVLSSIGDRIIDLYGPEYCALQFRDYAGNDKNHNMQNAHEAIRPTVFSRERDPDEFLKDEFHLTTDEFNLYKLIWARAVASQMREARYNETSMTIRAGDFLLKANGRKLEFQGWRIIADEIIDLAGDESLKNNHNDEVVLPIVNVGTVLTANDIYESQKQTKRPDRYGVGIFVETVFNLGIARPSTIGDLVSRLRDKGYIEVNRNGILTPTVLGMRIDKWVEENYFWLRDIEHAKIFEDEIRKIEIGDNSNFEGLIIEYHKKILAKAEELDIDISFLYSSEPTEKQKEYVLKLAKLNNIEVGDEVLKNKDKAEIFINKYKIDNKKIRKCPYCKDGDIKKFNDYFKCSNSNCDYFITNKRLIDFFSRFKKPVDDEFLSFVVKKASNQDGLLVEGLISKEGKEFKTKINFVKTDSFGWQLSFLK
ncbi:DNA topoisomerase [Aquamicrobium sp.]|uniref:type IA DNA topoisomerase n=1 Tax=Aquamicrobium sp. TaxID=1872579 RepID=UPI0025841B84|nr:DNA topoisomerase [Aquamicrobium sp.]MCK9549315.1 DNA topoisomerase [Aquamicrobium sp.]